MAQRVVTLLTDDVDGGNATETVSFSLDGTNYEIDLNEKNAAKLRSGLHPFIEKGRRHRTTRGKASTRRPNSRERSHEIRAWAKAKGIQVNDRGRIPANVVEQYEAAH